MTVDPALRTGVGQAPTGRFKLLALALTLCLPPIGGVLAAIGMHRAVRARVVTATLFFGALIVLALGWMMMVYALMNSGT
jgi:hypothetical protein